MQANNRRFQRFDAKGFFTGRPGTPETPRIFNAKKWWPRYDTKAVVDVWHAWASVQVKGQKVEIVSDGSIIEKTDHDELKNRIKASAEVFKGQEVDPRLFRETVGAEGISESLFGRLMRQVVDVERKQKSSGKHVLIIK